ncbi:MAG: amidohydrolase [Anaerolineae bacterium]|nr:amidohydrolase [Anaerolineae bacterium]
MVIDAHAHIIVPEMTRAAAPEESWRPLVKWVNEQQLIEFGGKTLKSAVREFVYIEGILAAQETAGVDRVLLCPWVSLLRYEAKPEEGLRLSQIYNRALARLAHAHPDRVSALGTVPLQDPPLAAQELLAVMAEPGLYGVEIAASVNGVYLGDDRFDPFWTVAEATGALVFIHPTTRGFDLPALNDYYLWNTIGNPLETTITAAHMIMAGVMERHPHLKVLLAHGGGTILSLRGRLRHSHTFQPQAKARLVESPEDSLRRFYFDTVTHDPALLQTLIDYVGVDHVLLGSDYPFDMGVERPAEMVHALNLSPADKAKILGGNAARLLT